MSQAGDVDVTGTHPEIPTKFVADSGTAVPIANTLEILGTAVAAGSIPLETVASGNTLTVQVQYSQSAVDSNATFAGISSFSSSDFGVDANGFVTILGGADAITNIDVDTSTPPGTDPVVPNMGNITMTGAQVSSGTVGANVLGTASLAPNTVTYQIQQSGSAASQNTALNGVAHFNSSQFTVANGFVSLAEDGQSIDSFTTDVSGPVSPNDAGNVDFTGSTNIYSDGSVTNTMRLNLQGTNHALFVGSGANTASVNIGTGSTGQILQSQGASTDPDWTTATYPPTTVANEILYSSATNVIGQITTANNSILSTNGSGVPSLGTSLANNYTFTSSTAATVRTLTVTNTDNTNAASGALIQVVSGGASAGDAVFQASTTTTTWSLGVDNSITTPTADPFVISQGTALGTNNVMSISTSGAMTRPLQPAFSASANLQFAVTGAGELYTIIFANKIFDQNNNFDGISTFTAPVAGRYCLSACAQISGLTTAMTESIFSIVTTGRAFSITPGNMGAMMGTDTNYETQINIIANMAAGDTAIVQIIISNGTQAASVNVNTYFMGYLLA